MPSDPRTLPLVLCAVVDGGEILLLRRENPPYRGYWGLPGGKFRFGESVAEAARREAREETGLATTFEGVVWAGTETIVDEAGDPEAHFVMFLVRLSAAGRATRSGPEGEVRWFPLDALAGIDVIETDRVLLSEHLRRTGSIGSGSLRVRRRGERFRLERLD